MVPFGGGGGGGENFNGGKLETVQGINEISFKFFFEKKLKKIHKLQDSMTKDSLA